MSLFIEGKIISGKQNLVSYKKNGVESSFSEFRAWVINPNEPEESPRSIKFGDKFTVEVGQDVKVPVRISPWTDKRGVSHFDLIAIHKD